MPGSLGSVQLAASDRRGNAQHQLYLLLFRQFDPGANAVSFILGKYGQVSTGIATRIKEKNTPDGVASSEYRLGEGSSSLRTLSRDR